jgi:hypothetical protein
MARVFLWNFLWFFLAKSIVTAYCACRLEGEKTMGELEDWVAHQQRVFDRRQFERNLYGYCYFDRHKQMRKGEVLVCNETEEVFQGMLLKTKRLGGVAYTFSGGQFPDSSKLVSVFAQRSELEELGIDCKTPEFVLDHLIEAPL